jgi:5-methylcytosine-specific restriction endonuclease McrA
MIFKESTMVSEHRRLYMKYYRQQNKEKILSQRKDYYLKNKEKELSKAKEWRASNPEKVKEYNTKPNYVHSYNTSFIRAKNKGGYITLTEEQKQQVFDIYKMCYRRAEIEGIEYEVDHNIPYSQGGKHTPDNLRILSKIEHLKKSNEERKDI